MKTGTMRLLRTALCIFYLIFFILSFFFCDHAILFIGRLWALSVQPKTFEAGKNATEVFLESFGTFWKELNFRIASNSRNANRNLGPTKPSNLLVQYARAKEEAWCFFHSIAQLICILFFSSSWSELFGFFDVRTGKLAKNCPAKVPVM